VAAFVQLGGLSSVEDRLAAVQEVEARLAALGEKAAVYQARCAGGRCAGGRFAGRAGGVRLWRPQKRVNMLVVQLQGCIMGRLPCWWSVGDGVYHRVLDDDGDTCPPGTSQPWTPPTWPRVLTAAPTGKTSLDSRARSTRSWRRQDHGPGLDLDQECHTVRSCLLLAPSRLMESDLEALQMRAASAHAASLRLPLPPK
jgi:hypothetical protein